MAKKEKECNASRCKLKADKTLYFRVHHFTISVDYCKTHYKLRKEKERTKRKILKAQAKRLNRMVKDD